MAVSDVLKNFRSSGYSKPSGTEEKDDNEDQPAVRTIKLTDEEVKDLQSYQKGPGEEQVCEVSGKLEDDGHFHVMSVRSPGNDMHDMASEVAQGSNGGIPLMNQQTQPSPS